MDAKEEYKALMRMREKASKALKAIDFLDTTRQLGLKGRRLTKSLRHFYETTDVKATFDALHWYVAELDAELDRVFKKAEASNVEVDEQ